jgi:hypothetical protein
LEKTAEREEAVEDMDEVLTVSSVSKTFGQFQALKATTNGK